MAKRGVIDHPKFARLKACLKLGKFQTLGILEAIWQFTGRYTPQGNIGKYTDEEIEAWVEWDGEEGDLVAALIKCGWLDRCPINRIIVHDWHDHIDHTTSTALKRSRLDVLRPGEQVAQPAPKSENTVSTPLEQCANSVRTVCAPPEPEPVPEPENPPASQSPQGVTKRTVKPSTIEEVMAYGLEIDLPPEECEKFWDHFESNGWRVGGKTAMKNWHAALRNWRKTWAERIKAQSRAKPAGNAPPGVDPDRRAPKGDGVDYVLRERDGVVMPKDPKDPSKPFDAVGWFRSRNLPITSQWEQYCDDQEERAA